MAVRAPSGRSTAAVRAPWKSSSGIAIALLTINLQQGEYRRMAAPVMAVICSGQQDVIIGDMKPGGFLLAGIISTLPLVAQNTGSNGPVVSVSEIYLIGSVHNMHFEERYH